MKINYEKSQTWTPLDPHCPHFFFGGGGFSSNDSPLKFWDVMPPYRRHFLSKKEKIDNFDNFRLAI